MDIITCCSSIDAEGNEFRALVLDFMPNSSLDRWLHPTFVGITRGRVLSVVQRFNIAVDIADALSSKDRKGDQRGVNGSLEFLSKYLAAVPRSPSKHNLVAKLRILKPTGDESI
jgi:hypothetical protein